MYAALAVSLVNMGLGSERGMLCASGIMLIERIGTRREAVLTGNGSL